MARRAPRRAGLHGRRDISEGNATRGDETLECIFLYFSTIFPTRFDVVVTVDEFSELVLYTRWHDVREVLVEQDAPQRFATAVLHGVQSPERRALFAQTNLNRAALIVR